jgi:hypothetical protein
MYSGKIAVPPGGVGLDFNEVKIISLIETDVSGS